MFRRQSILTVAGALVLTAAPAFSQEGGSIRNEFTVQALGSFLKTTTNSGVNQSATDSGGVLGSYRFFFNALNGVEVNYGYSLNTQKYGLPSGVIGVSSHSNELTAAYVFRHPLRRWSPFVLAGAGALVFDPRDSAGASTQTRATFLYGGGADFSLSRHFFVRAEYRGLLYSSPTYDLPALSGTDRITHRAEPSVGFGYRF